MPKGGGKPVVERGKLNAKMKSKTQKEDEGDDAAPRTGRKMWGKMKTEMLVRKGTAEYAATQRAHSPLQHRWAGRRLTLFQTLFQTVKL